MAFDTIDVEVTEEDISLGKPGQCPLCPIALAIRRLYPDAWVSVGITYCQINDFRYDLPEKAIDFIRHFDFSRTGPKPKPIKFRLEDGSPSTYWL